MVAWISVLGGLPTLFPGLSFLTVSALVVATSIVAFYGFWNHHLRLREGA